jgi:putative transposase
VLKAENQSYRLDTRTGRLRLPIRSGEHIEIDLALSVWHRKFLEDSSWRLGSVTVTPSRVVLAVRKNNSVRLEPQAAIALDTNEESLDGALAANGKAALITVPLGGIRQIQTTYFRRRRQLARKKADDSRVRRRLLKREGIREKNRVRHRINVVAKRIVEVARAHKAAIVLEDLRVRGFDSPSRRINRRLGSWPRGRIHSQIEYKAALAGVPVIKVNPAWTSKTCPACGARRRDRVGKVFVCLMCDWEMDRQINAGLNILKTALASNEALARAVRFQPGALRHDVVIPLYDLFREGGGAREEPSGVEFRATVTPALNRT